MQFQSPHHARNKSPPDPSQLASYSVLEVLEAGLRNWHPDLSLHRRLSLYLCRERRLPPCQRQHQLLGSLLPNLCPRWPPLLLHIAGLARRAQ